MPRSLPVCDSVTHEPVAQFLAGPDCGEKYAYWNMFYGPKIGDVEPVYAWGKLEDMVGGAKLLNNVIEDRKKEIGSMALTIGKHQKPRPLEEGFPQSITLRESFELPDEGEFANHRATMAFEQMFRDMDKIMPKDIIKDSYKDGYWSMRLPSLSSSAVEKAAIALKLMAGNSDSMTCAYIDTPFVLCRFDFRERKFNGYRTHANESAGQSLWRGVCNSRNTLQAMEHAEAMGAVVPYAEDVIEFTDNDGDALIVPEDAYGKAISPDLIDKFLKHLKGHMLRHFSWRGLNLHVKKSRNELLMSYNCSEEELRARALLCEMIGFDAYKNYLRRGFIEVRGRSTGWIYVLRGGHSMIDCFAKSEKGWYLKDRICIQFKDHGLTHTDAVIMRKLFVEHDEFGLRKASNITPSDIEQSLTAAEGLREERRRSQKQPVRISGRDEMLTLDRTQQTG